MLALSLVEGTQRGTKLSQEVVNTSNTVTKTSDYVGAFHYEDGDLVFLQMEEGRVRLDGSDWVYEYQLKVEDLPGRSIWAMSGLYFGSLSTSLWRSE
ncbi:MAG: hypothetical protein R3C61_06605 [Bacteroidia bacterium]